MTLPLSTLDQGSNERFSVAHNNKVLLNSGSAINEFLNTLTKLITLMMITLTFHIVLLDWLRLNITMIGEIAGVFEL